MRGGREEVVEHRGGGMVTGRRTARRGRSITIDPRAIDPRSRVLADPCFGGNDALRSGRALMESKMSGPCRAGSRFGGLLPDKRGPKGTVGSQVPARRENLVTQSQSSGSAPPGSATRVPILSRVPEALELTSAIEEVKERGRFGSECGNLTERSMRGLRGCAPHRT